MVWGLRRIYRRRLPAGSLEIDLIGLAICFLLLFVVGFIVGISIGFLMWGDDE